MHADMRGSPLCSDPMRGSPWPSAIALPLLICSCQITVFTGIKKADRRKGPNESTAEKVALTTGYALLSLAPDHVPQGSHSRSRHDLRCKTGAVSTYRNRLALGRRKCNARSGLYDMPDLADCKSWTRNLLVFVATVTCEGEGPAHEPPPPS